MSVLSAMEYPEDWMMVAGAVLLVLGFIGFCISQNR
jgi:preprotein translocase subunit Sss1